MTGNGPNANNYRMMMGRMVRLRTNNNDTGDNHGGDLDYCMGDVEHGNELFHRFQPLGFETL